MAIKAAVNKSVEAYRQRSYGQDNHTHDFIYSQLRPVLSKKPELKLLDIGCGDGGFLYYLKQRHPNLNAAGLEIDPGLVAKAKAEPGLKGVRFLKGDAQKFRLGEKFDAVLLSGVLSIFDEIEKPMSRAFDHLKPGGQGFVFGGFCSRDIDVIVRYRNNFLGSKTWESGLNMFSLQRFQDWLSRRAKNLKVTEFKIPGELEKKENPVRTFTLNTKEEGRIVLNGANIRREFYLVTFIKGAR